MRRRLVILGATGSIGASTLRVVAAHPDRFEVVGLAAGRDAAGLRALAERFGVRHLALAQPNDAGIPHIKLGIDQQMRDFGQARTAIQAFADVLSMQ